MAKDGEQWRTLTCYLPPKTPGDGTFCCDIRQTLDEARVNGADRGGDRLDSWKEIAAYLKRGARTVQRWEREQGLPVHRLIHDKLGSIYAYRSELDAWWRSREAELANEPPLPAETAPSVAVLPFADLSRERDQAYFCEGMAEEILDALGRIHGLRVSSRTASFHFRTPDADTREIGRRLRVGTLLAGSVRKSADQLRIVVQLTDAESGFQLWSGRYSREMSDIFAVQQEIAENVVFQARHCFALGQIEKAARLYEECARVNPDDYQSPLLVAQIYEDLGRPADAMMARRCGIEVAERHLRLNPDDARALYMAANALVALGKCPQGQQWAERALAIRPNDPMLLYNVGCVFSMLGRVEPAIECLEEAARNGLTQKGWYENDSNLDPLREHRRFQELLEKLC